MSYSLYLAIALAILAVILVGFGVSGYVIRWLAGRQEWQTHSFVRFLARYVVIFGILLGLEALVLWVFPAFHEQLRESAASVVASILHLAGVEASVNGPLVAVGSNEAVFNITVACLGGVLFWVYLSLVLSESGATRGQRLKGTLIGLGILFAFNILRMTISVYLEGSAGLRVHDYFYVVNMLVVLLVWAGWAKTLRPEGRTLKALA